MTLRILVTATVALMLAACDPGAPPDPREIEEAQDPDRELGAAATLNVGDVEAQVWVEGTLDPEFDDPNVEVIERVDQRQRRNLVEITVAPPYPDELWLLYETTAVRTFPDTPAVIRTRILRDGEEIGRIAGVFGAEAHLADYSTRVDALEGLDEIPDRLLITTEGESLLMPAGTETEELDPWEATTQPGRRSNFVYCNPIRIEFLEAEEDTPEDTPDAEADEEPEEEPAPDEEPQLDGDEEDEGPADAAEATNEDGDAR